MAYDERLAERIREILDGEPGVTEKRMFGGLAFLVEGHLAIAASGQGGALVRVDPTASDRLVDHGTAERAVMRGRPMQGWLRVPAETLRTRRSLDAWVRRSTTYAHGLAATGERAAQPPR